MTAKERIYIIGGTGNTGRPVVEGLLKAKIPVTILTRSPDKTRQMFSTGQEDDDLLRVVQGDYSNHTAFKESVPGHDRLFMVTHFYGPFDVKQLKIEYAKIAYADWSQANCGHISNRSWFWLANIILSNHEPRIGGDYPCYPEPRHVCSSPSRSFHEQQYYLRQAWYRQQQCYF